MENGKDVDAPEEDVVQDVAGAPDKKTEGAGSPAPPNGNGATPAQAPPHQQGWPPQPQMPPQGYYPPPPPGYYPPPPPRPRKKRSSNKPQVVGSLLIIVAVLGFITASMFGFAFAFTSDSSNWFPTDENIKVTVSGTVTALNGTPIEGASVLIVDKAISAVTDDEGNYILYEVPVGDQTIRCAKDGYTTINRRVTVGEPFMGFNFEGDHRQRQNFVLSLGTGDVTTGNWIDEDFFNMFGFLAVCMAIIIICSILALLGGWFAFKRTNLPFVVLGCVAGIFTLGMIIGSVLAFIALFILLLSLDEFRAQKAEPEAE